jgi:steroid 5-alpha reductase family enzyme
MTVLSLIGMGWLALAAAMGGFWLAHRAIQNAAIVDVGWALGLPLLALWYAWRLDAGPRGWVLAVLVVVWGVRLALYLFLTRVVGHPEDGRYVDLRKGWGDRAGVYFFIFFQAQAVLDVVLSAPLLIAIRHRGALGPVEWAGVALWVVAVVGEAAADRQLAAFRREPRHRGQVCQAGLWAYSRHPNYFFEWLIWVAYALYASASPFGWLGWIAPAIMLYFLFRITGIPATEAQALRSRGDAYRRYQQTTSAFVPWFRRGGAA